MKLKQNLKITFLSLFVLIGTSITISSCSSDDDSGPAQSSDKLITSFVFSNLNPPVGGTITANAITVTVGSNTDVTNLVPTIVISPEATVSPASGAAQNFSSPVTYTVTAEDGSTANYTVTVSRTQSSEAEITDFVFAGLTPPVDGVITDTSIAATIPFDADITALTPTIVISMNATVSPNTGVAQNFATPVNYTVTAQDGTTKVFTVTISQAAAPGLNIEPIWEKTLASGGESALPSWFTGNNDRDLSVSSEYIYVHNNLDKLRVLSLTDGSDVSAGVDGDAANPNKEFINGKQNFASGTFALSGTSTDSQGKIIASNMLLAAENIAWNVYKWDSKDATQELLFAYPKPVGLRLGDNITVVGDVSTDATIYAPSAGTNKVLKFDITGGVADVVPTEIILEDITSLGSAPDVSLVSSGANANFIAVGTGISNIAEYSQDGTLIGKLPESLNDGENSPIFKWALDVKSFEISGRKLIATTATDFTDDEADDGYLYIIDYTNGLENVTADDIRRIAFTPAGNTQPNFNGTGGVDVSLDGNEATVYALITNFGIGAYKVTFD